MKTKRIGRGRPPKEKGERKDVDLRIPVTSDQKELVSEAAKREDMDMAAWARQILIDAAKRQKGVSG